MHYSKAVSPQTSVTDDLLIEVPSNWIMEKYFPQTPSKYIGLITLLWGVMMTLHGVVQDFGGIVTVRFLMGIFEAGLFPAAVTVSLPL